MRNNIFFVMIILIFVGLMTIGQVADSNAQNNPTITAAPVTKTLIPGTLEQDFMPAVFKNAAPIQDITLTPTFPPD